MEIKYIDAHSHLNFPEYDADREEVIARAREAGVGMIVVGTGREMSARAVEIAEKYEGVWAIIGLHPTDAREEAMKSSAVMTGVVGFDHDYYLKLAQHPKVVGIGECGYDFFHTDGTEEDERAQHEAFLGQIDIANAVKKPLMLHLRNGKDATKNAYIKAVAVLKERAQVIGDVHFFAGSFDEARGFLDLGFNLSFTGVITFARNYDDVIRGTPLDRIISETDAPYVTPIPHRGKRNEPVFVIEVARKIAEIRGEDPEKVRAQLVENTRKLFSI